MHLSGTFPEGPVTTYLTNYTDYASVVGATTGTWIAPFDGTYTFELYGGNASHVQVGCHGTNGGGGHGGYIKIQVTLKKGDQISYNVANGGVKQQLAGRYESNSCDENTYAYDSGGTVAHVAMGCKGNDTSITLNGTWLATAQGGFPGMAWCVPTPDFHWRMYGDIQSVYTSMGSSFYDMNRFENDDACDPNFGGHGGKSSYNSAKCSVIKQVTGADGQQVPYASWTQSVEREGLALQSWYQSWHNTYPDQQPGMILIEYKHQHTYTEPKGECLVSHTQNRVCTVCGGVNYGQVEIPALGHDWKVIPNGTEGYECTPGSTYLKSTQPFESVKQTWGSTPNWYYCAECARCGARANPQEGFGYVEYKTHQGTGTVPKSSFLKDREYNLETAVGKFTWEGHRAIGWEDTSHTYTNTNDAVKAVESGYQFSQKVKNFVEPGKTRVLWTVWKPLWKLVFSNQITSLPVNGEANPDNHSSSIQGTIPTDFRWYDYYDKYSGVQSIIRDGGHTLPTLSLKGWTFKGWEVDGAQITDNTNWTWDQDKTTHPMFQENTYSVKYHDAEPEKDVPLEATAIAQKLHYESTYSVYSAATAGFSHNGYYLDGWTPDLKYHAPTWKVALPSWIEEGRSTTDTFKQLKDKDGDMYDMYAIWKPVPVTIRVWDNYKQTEAPYAEYTAYCEHNFHLPSQSEFLSAAGIAGRDSKLMGYVTEPTHVANGRADYVSVDYSPSSEMFISINTSGLTERPVINVYCVWDDAPKISCNDLPKITRDVAVAAGYDVSDGTITMTELESLILTKSHVHATDYEYTMRYGNNEVPIGNNHGYSVRVAAIDPVSMHDTLVPEGDAVDYVVTFMVTDDAGQQATATADLYFGSEMSILKDTR